MTNTPDTIDPYRLQLAVIEGHIEHAKKDGYSTQITLHALNVLRLRFTEMLAQQDAKDTEIATVKSLLSHQAKGYDYVSKSLVAANEVLTMQAQKLNDKDAEILRLLDKLQEIDGQRMFWQVAAENQKDNNIKLLAELQSLKEPNP